MDYLDNQSATICAISTPPGTGGVAVIRLSGSQSDTIIRKICPFLPHNLDSHRVYYGFVVASCGKKMDEVLVTYFKHGKSFTGEQTFEVSCHGSSYISQQILNLLILNGATQALRGEFTCRAFMNGRIDLIQAENVLSLIESSSKSAADLSFRQLEGELSLILKKMEEDLTWALMNLEANIDFAHEDILVAKNFEIKERVDNVNLELEALLNSYELGCILKEGVRVALVGAPNVGKSKLLNSLSGESKAIVTDIAGTTRDMIESSIREQGILITFIDTAGLRETENEVEIIGINKTKELIENVDLVLCVLDSSRSLLREEIKNIEGFSKLKNVNVLYLPNKSDLLKSEDDKIKYLNDLKDKLPINKEILLVSALDGNGMSCLKSYIIDSLVKGRDQGAAMIHHGRHFELLKKMKDSIDKFYELKSDDVGFEFITFELQQALYSLYEILGKEFDDQVMDLVFSKFCLGK